MKNYYEILEVSQNASPEVIEKAYKALAKKYHPDANPDNIKESEEKFKEISEAYEILSDATKKADYDYQLEAYINNSNNSNQYNDEDYENLMSHAQQLENELEYLKRTNKASQYSSDNIINTDNNINTTVNNNNNYNNINQETFNEFASSLNDTINKAYSKAYNDAYIKRLQDYGYRIKYKKPLKTILKNLFSTFMAIIFLALILFILWQIPSIKEYFINLYNNNYFFQIIVNIFIKD